MCRQDSVSSLTDGHAGPDVHARDGKGAKEREKLPRMSCQLRLKKGDATAES